MFLFDPVVRIFWEGKSFEGWREPNRRIYDHELVFVSAGEFWLRINDKSTLMRAGMIAIIPPATWHESWTSPSQTAVRHCVHFDWSADFQNRQAPLMSFAHEPFDVSLVRNVPPLIDSYLPLVIRLEKGGGLRQILEVALKYLRCDSSMKNAMLWPVLRGLLDLQTDRPAQAKGGKTERSVMMVKHYIESHYAEEIGYPEFNALVDFSRSHLCQAFSRQIGKSPIAYLNDIRVHQAVELLQTTSLNIAEVGRKVGVPDPNYFSRLFRKKIGLSPSEFLRRKCFFPS